MKKFLITILVLGLFFMVGYVECHYIKEATVVEINDNVITVRDTTGNKWDFFGSNYQVNDKVILKMYNNHTDNIIIDDEIIDVIYN